MVHHTPKQNLFYWIWIWKLICKAPTGQNANRLDVSSRAGRHKLALENVQGASLCHMGRKLIPLSHSSENELVPNGRSRIPRSGSLVLRLLPWAGIWHQVDRLWLTTVGQICPKRSINLFSLIFENMMAKISPYRYFSALNPFLTLFFRWRNDVMTFLRH